MLKGIDVSAVQGKIDWKQVAAAGFRFAIRKVSEGTSYGDGTAAANAIGIREAGMYDSVYGFLRPSMGNPAVQAKNLWDRTGDTSPCLPPTLDLENAPDSMSAKDLVDFFLVAADAVEDLFGRPPMVYTFPYFAKTRIVPALTPEVSARLARCPLWMADYSAGENPAETWRPYTPKPWTEARLAQVSGDKSSHVPGIGGAVDHDIFFGTEEELRAFCGFPPVTTTADEIAIIHPAIEFAPRDPQTEE